MITSVKKLSCCFWEFSVQGWFNILYWKMLAIINIFSFNIQKMFWTRKFPNGIVRLYWKTAGGGHWSSSVFVFHCFHFIKGEMNKYSSSVHSSITHWDVTLYFYTLNKLKIVSQVYTCFSFTISYSLVWLLSTCIWAALKLSGCWLTPKVGFVINCSYKAIRPLTIMSLAWPVKLMLCRPQQFLN